MSINSILNSVSAALAQQSSATSVRSSTPTTPVTTTNTEQSNDSAPSQPVLQNANLLNASSSFAQLSTLLEVAQSGTEQVGSILEQLQSLAQQASTTGPATDLTTINSEFQNLVSQIGQVVKNTTFGGVSLLDGTLSGGTTDNGLSSTLELPDLSAQSLLGGNQDISTAQNAASTLAALATGQNTVDAAGSSIEDVITQLSFASASVNTALANSEAASSTLTEADLEQAGTGSSLANLLSDSAANVLAQTGRLPTGILSLIQDS